MSLRLTDRELRIVVTIASEGSVRAAAEKLHVTQPGLSRTLKNVEERIGLRLFDRTLGGMVPTAAGRMMIHRAEDVLTRLGDLETLMQDLSAGAAGEIRVGYTDDAHYGWFPDAVQAWLHLHDRIDIRLVEGYSPDIAVRVADGELDLGLISPPIPPNLTDVELAPIRPLPLRIAVAADVPEADATSLPLSAIAEKTIITGSLHPESGFYLQMMQILAELKSANRFRHGIYPTAMIANMVAAGLGWSLLTEDSVLLCGHCRGTYTNYLDSLSQRFLGNGSSKLGAEYIAHASGVSLFQLSSRQVAGAIHEFY